MDEAKNPNFFQPIFNGGVSVMVSGYIGPNSVQNPPKTKKQLMM